MSNEAINLLRQLGSGVRPAGAGDGAGKVSTAGQIGAGQFADLLNRAREGEFSSSRPVTIASDAGVVLTEDQLAMITMAADKAEVDGIRDALVLIDGKALRLDVANRSITGQADLSSGVLAGVDGIINLSPEIFARDRPSPPLPPPPVTSPSASLAALLGAREGERPAAA